MWKKMDYGAQVAKLHKKHRLGAVFPRITHSHILVIFSITFFVVYSFLPLFHTALSKFNFPDEQVNHFFASLYSQTGELSYSEELNEVAHGIIRMRGTVYLEGEITPVRFLGFAVISGTVGVISPEAMRFITPLLAIIGAIFLYLLLRDLFNKRIALLSFLLVLIMPPFWFWGTWTMLENVAACSMLIISLRYFFKLLETGDARHYILWGLFLGLSLFIRADYVLFAIPLLIILLWNRRRIKWAYVSLSAFFFMAALGPFFILNAQLYGSPLITGQHMKYSLTQLTTITTFTLGNILTNSINLIKMTPVLFLSGLLGLLYCLRKKVQLQYMVLLVASLLALLIYYLSGRIVLGKIYLSYQRYFLPIYLLSLPLISYFILSFKQKIISVLLVLSILVISVLAVLPAIGDRLETFAGWSEFNNRVVNTTEADAVIFLLDAIRDRQIFPERKVGLIRELPEENRGEILSEILIDLSEMDVPVYILDGDKPCISRNALAQQLSAEGYTLSETEVRDLYQVLKEG